MDFLSKKILTSFAVYAPIQRNLMPPKHKPIKVEKKLGRNEKCNCGSGKKYKHCCLNQKSKSDK